MVASGNIIKSQLCRTFWVVKHLKASKLSFPKSGRALWWFIMTAVNPVYPMMRWFVLHFVFSVSYYHYLYSYGYLQSSVQVLLPVPACVVINYYYITGTIILTYSMS